MAVRYWNSDADVCLLCDSGTVIKTQQDFWGGCTRYYCIPSREDVTVVLLQRTSPKRYKILGSWIVHKAAAITFDVPTENSVQIVKKDRGQMLTVRKTWPEQWADVKPTKRSRKVTRVTR